MATTRRRKPAKKKSPARRSDTPLAVVKRACAAFNRHDVEGILNEFADRPVWYLSYGPKPYGTKLVGKPAIRKILEARYATIQGLNWAVIRHFVQGHIVCSEWTLTGRPESGPPMNLRGLDIWEVRGGKIVMKDTYWKNVVKS